MLPHETSSRGSTTAPPGRPEAARVVWRWDAPTHAPSSPPRRHIAGPVVGLTVAIALVLVGRRAVGLAALTTASCALALELLRPTLAARARDLLAKSFTGALLAVAWVLLFTPLRLLRGRDRLGLDVRRDAQSFWTRRDGRPQDAGRLY